MQTLKTRKWPAMLSRLPLCQPCHHSGAYRKIHRRAPPRHQPQQTGLGKPRARAVKAPLRSSRRVLAVGIRSPTRFVSAAIGPADRRGDNSHQPTVSRLQWNWCRSPRFRRFNSEYALADTAGAVAALGRHTALSVVPHSSGSGTTFSPGVNGGGPS